jgi:hypothetical protein
MKRELSSVYLALILIVGCVTFRLISSQFPEFIPNVSPLMAIAFVGSMYLPHRWGWLVGPSTLVVTQLAFLDLDYRTGGSGAMLSWWTVTSLLFYGAIFALAGGFGILISRRKSLAKIIGGSIACSIFFYLVSNTFSWWYDGMIRLTPGYPATLAGWWQANTVGVAGYPPTWLFLRNALAGDLFFAFVLLLALDRGLLFGASRAKVMTRTASV